ncbi:MAG: hypothetical protein SGCHY_004703, partial [Lobulomycetales sp.]
MHRLAFISHEDWNSFLALYRDASPEPGMSSGRVYNKPIGTGRITGEAASATLRRSGLPSDVLGHIWSLSCLSGASSLSWPEFMLAMHLTKTKVSGAYLPVSLPDAVRMEVVGAMNSIPSSNSTSLPQNQTSGNSQAGSWAIDPMERSKYNAVFRTWDPSNSGYIDGSRARNIFSQSSLPDNILAHIWSLSDINNHGKLNADEFAVAMHLLYRKLAGIDLPSTLPQELVPPSTRDFNNMASVMKSQVMTDLASKPSSLSFQRTSVSGTEYISANSVAVSEVDSASAEADRAVEESLMRDLETEIEDTRKELALISPQIDASKAAVSDVLNEIAECKRLALELNSQIILSMSFVPSSGLKATGLETCGVDDLEAILRKLEAKAEECKRLEDLASDKYLQQHAPKRLESSSSISSLIGPSGNTKAAALLAQRMAALGVGDSSSGLNTSSHGEIDAERDSKKAEVDSCLRQSRSLVDGVRGSLSSRSPFAWKPARQDVLKFQQGVGFHSDLVVRLVKELHSAIPDLSVDNKVIKNPIVALSSTPAEKKLAKRPPPPPPKRGNNPKMKPTSSGSPSIVDAVKVPESVYSAQIYGNHGTFSSAKSQDTSEMKSPASINSFNNAYGGYPKGSYGSASDSAQYSRRDRLAEPIDFVHNVHGRQPDSVEATLPSESLSMSADSDMKMEHQGNFMHELHTELMPKAANSSANFLGTNKGEVHLEGVLMYGFEKPRDFPEETPQSPTKRFNLDTTPVAMTHSTLKHESPHPNSNADVGFSAIPRPSTPPSNSSAQIPLPAPSQSAAEESSSKGLFDTISACGPPPPPPPPPPPQSSNYKAVRASTTPVASLESAPQTAQISMPLGERSDLMSAIRSADVKSLQSSRSKSSKPFSLVQANSDINGKSSTSSDVNHGSISRKNNDASFTSAQKSMVNIFDGPSRGNINDGNTSASNSLDIPTSAALSTRPDSIRNTATLAPSIDAVDFSSSSSHPGIQGNEKDHSTPLFVEDSKALFVVEGLYDFSGSRPDDLSFSCGDRIDVFTEHGEWLYGKKNGAPGGWFPRAFTKPLGTETLDLPEDKGEVPGNPFTITKAKVIYDYDAARDDEIRLTAGDIVTVLGKPDVNWWRISSSHGSGYAPSSYLEEGGDITLAPLKLPMTETQVDTNPFAPPSNNPFGSPAVLLPPEPAEKDSEESSQVKTVRK